MRVVRVTLSVGIAAVMLVALAGEASAKASAAVCKKVAITEADTGELGGETFNAANVTKAAKAFKSGANAAPGNVKRAMKTIADYYQRTVDAHSANGTATPLTARDSKKFAKATVTWGIFVANNCS